jgi:hypothetical protein
MGHVGVTLSGAAAEACARGPAPHPQEPTEPEPEHAAQTTRGVVLRDGDSAAAKLHGRPVPVVVDSATRARILERSESATRRTHASAPMPAG